MPPSCPFPPLRGELARVEGDLTHSRRVLSSALGSLTAGVPLLVLGHRLEPGPELASFVSELRREVNRLSGLLAALCAPPAPLEVDLGLLPLLLSLPSGGALPSGTSLRVHLDVAKHLSLRGWSPPLVLGPFPSQDLVRLLAHRSTLTVHLPPLSAGLGLAAAEVFSTLRSDGLSVPDALEGARLLSRRADCGGRPGVHPPPASPRSSGG